MGTVSYTLKWTQLSLGVALLRGRKTLYLQQSCTVERKQKTSRVNAKGCPTGQATHLSVAVGLLRAFHNRLLPYPTKLSLPTIKVPSPVPPKLLPPLVCGHDGQY